MHCFCLSTYPYFPLSVNVCLSVCLFLTLSVDLGLSVSVFSTVAWRLPFSLFHSASLPLSPVFPSVCLYVCLSLSLSGQLIREPPYLCCQGVSKVRSITPPLDSIVPLLALKKNGEKKEKKGRTGINC